jgi:lipopolysaccharide export system protein LptA
MPPLILSSHSTRFAPQSVRPRTLVLVAAVSVLALAFGVVCGPAHAEKADRNKPMFIESDALRVDDLKQVSVATGKVVVTKGSIIIRGARVEVRQDAEGYQYGVATGEPGGRAFYRQKREALDEFIEGDGETIVYDGKADTVRFIKRGEMRRFKGAQLFDETSGNVIVYDNGADVFTVDSGTNPGTPGTGRVRTMLTPNPTLGAAAVTPTAPASSAPLRQSSALSGLTLGGPTSSGPKK